MMCGIEIHQRISGRKLFCNCVPVEEEQEKQHFSRYLHAVRSELGELDSAVRLEAIRGRHIQYEAPTSSSCLVESDEEPPHNLNPEALHTVLTFCSLVSSRPVDEVQVMRKNVIDGSNTSGFQRTAVVGVGGSIKTASGPLELQAICIEEESAGILQSKKEGGSSYDLSRLSIPLIEIATAPGLKSGKEAGEAALAIGTLLRSTGMVSRGIGSIRQDLNISIPEGARVEIKGVQTLSQISETVELEAKRQHNLSVLSKELSLRLKGRQVEASFADLSEIFSETKSKMVSHALKSGLRAFGLLLPLHAGFLSKELGPNRRYGSELADYARATGVRGLIHSDEDLAKYGFSDDEISEVRIALSVGEADAFAIVLGDKKKALAALSEVVCRANTPGVPEETRRANPDGTSCYMRPLPGRARMYPETDIPPIPITAQMLNYAKEAASGLHAAEAEKKELLSTLNSELAAQLSAARNLISHSPSFPLSQATPELSAFASAVESGIDAKFASSTITNTLQSLKREGADTKKLDEQKLISTLLLCQNGKITKAAVAEVLREMCKDGAASAESSAKKLGVERITGKALEHLLHGCNNDLRALMSKYRLQADAQEAQELLKKIGK